MVSRKLEDDIIFIRNVKYLSNLCLASWESGDDVKIKPYSKAINGQTLFIYSPTDCIRDRLASYIHFKARGCLDQAVLVAKTFPFNQSKVKKLCTAEGALEAFEVFMKKIKE